MRPTYATVRLDAIRDNYRLACDRAPASKTMAVIKANAYGHGLIRVARVLEPMVPAFAVATIDEAVMLRDAGIASPVAVLQGVSESADIAEAAARDLWLVMHETWQIESLLESDGNSPVTAWLKLDTGMHRFGLTGEELETWYPRLAASPRVKQDLVLCTHLAAADELGNPCTQSQLELIRKAANRYKLPTSIANSAGVLFWPDSHAHWNRPGIMLYGISPLHSTAHKEKSLRPAMSLHSQVIAVRKLVPGDAVGYGGDWVARRDSIVGTIPVGFGDGYPRHAPSGTPVLVNGQRVPLAGRVSMDAISVDLTDLDSVAVGDSVELWGENISIDEVAEAAGTISYELVAGLTGRVPLRYTG
jgi:alanine racemase